MWVTAALTILLMPAPNGERAEEIVKQVFEDGRYQREWPSEDGAVNPGEGRTGERVDTGPRDRAPAARGRPVESRSRSQSGDSASFGKVFLGILAGIAVLVIVVLLVRAVMDRHPDRAASARVAEARAPPAPAPALSPAEALAGEGKFDEAVHALLLEAIGAVAPAERHTTRTSREVLDVVRLAPEPRRAMEGLVRAVEISLFGGRPAGRAEWLACLDLRRTLAGTGATP